MSVTTPPSAPTTLIVGGSSLVGIATARQFSANGHTVIATHRNSFPAAIAGLATWLPLDLADDTSIEGFKERLLAVTTSLDTVIFVAGILPGHSLEEYSGAEMNTVMSINFLGQAKCLKAVLPVLNTSAQILMISSISGERGSYDPIYAASKGAIIAFVKSLATWLPPKVRCLAIAPGTIEGSAMYQAMSPATRQAHLDRTPLKELLAADDLALVILNLTMKHWAHANGTCIRLNGGAYV